MNHFPTAESYHVQLFGGPKLFRGSEEISLSPIQAALVGLLFGRDEPDLERDRAVAVLWPDEESVPAKHRLSQHLYTLRIRVGKPGILEARKYAIRRLPSGVTCDLDRYKEALQKLDLLTCSELLKKRFLPADPGFTGRPYPDWIAARAAEFRQEFRTCAERQWRACSREERWEEACFPAEALLNLYPDEEDRLQSVMEARIKAGRPVEAEEAYQEFASCRSGEDWIPHDRTKDLIEGVNRLALGAGDEPREVGQGLPEPPLLGRNRERTVLRQTLRTTPRRELRGVMISGEAGIGKTRLIYEALHGLPIDGQRVFSAQSAELERLIPLNPLIEAFCGPTVRAVLRELEEPWRTVLYGVMPGHFPGDGPIPEAPHIQPGSVPRRLFEAFYQLLLSLVGEGPVTLVLEDLQWADDTTLSVLDFLVRRWDHGQLQLLVSARSEEIRKNAALGRFLENFRVHVDFHEIPLPELEPPDCEALIRHLAPRHLPPGRITQLRSLAGGNPYFLIELTLEFLAGRLGPMEAPQDIVPIPVSIRQVLDRRLSELSPEAERVLGSLSVLSRPIETRDLGRITQLPGPDCHAGLDQLHRFRFVTGSEKVVVSHELVRQTFYQSLTDSRRAWLHNRAARHILRTRKPVPSDELALHFHRAGSSEEAKTYATEAADHAEASGAVPEALRFLRIAREHSTEPTVVAELIGRMGHLNYKHQNLEEAAPLLELAAQRFRRQGHQAKALRAEVERIDCLAQRGSDLGIDCLEELQLLKDEASSAELWEVFQDALDVEAHQFDREGDLEGVRSVLRQAQESLNLGPPEARCKARGTVALNIYFGSQEIGPPERSLRAARESVAIALGTSDSELILHALNRLILVLHYQGKLHTEEGKRALSEAESRLGTCGDLILKFHIKLNPAVWHLEIGELDQARASLEALEQLVGGNQSPAAQARLRLNLGELGLVSHDFPFAETAFRAAEELAAWPSPPFFRTLATAGIGLCSLSIGNLTEARIRESQLPEFPEFWTYDPTIVATFKARMLAKRRDTVRALELLDQTRAGVVGRLVPAWLRLTIEQTRLCKRVYPKKALELADEGLEVAGKLGLKQRVYQLHRLRETLV